jgi:hypothetical protein
MGESHLDRVDVWAHCIEAGKSEVVAGRSAAVGRVLIVGRTAAVKMEELGMSSCENCPVVNKGMVNKGMVNKSMVVEHLEVQ